MAVVVVCEGRAGGLFCGELPITLSIFIHKLNKSLITKYNININASERRDLVFQKHNRFGEKSWYNIVFNSLLELH